MTMHFNFYIATFTVCLSVLFTLQTSAQTTELHTNKEQLSKSLNTISQDTLKNLLSYIASEECEGRETGSEGIRKAATFIEDFYKKSKVDPGGINDSYFQEVEFSWIFWEDIYLEARGETYKHLWSFLAFQDENSNLKNFECNEVVFLGYGIDDPAYSDYENKDVSNKVVLIYKGEPVNQEGIYHITNSDQSSQWYNNIDLKAKTAYRHGAKLVLVIEDEMRKVLAENRRFLIGPKVLLGPPDSIRVTNKSNTLLISTTLAKDIIGEQFANVIKLRDNINETGQSGSVIIPIDFKVHMEKKVTSLACQNVLGKIEGTDDSLKNEYIVLSAHYDHLGKRGDDIYFGADDDGSGTVAVMEIMRNLAIAKSKGNGPKRSVIAMHFTGEEKGLLGSKYYVNHPIYPLEKTMANLNIDMIGRIDDIYIDNPDYVYVIGADKISRDLHDINEEINNEFVEITLDYTYNDDNDPNRFYYRSDHYNFASKGIPIIFYFNGTHEDYHLTSDTFDKIHFGKIEKISKLAFGVTMELANRPNPLELKTGL